MSFHETFGYWSAYYATFSTAFSLTRNIGNGLANNIGFQLSRSIPKNAWGLSKEQAKDASPMQDVPFVLGIPALGPGEERKRDRGQYGGLINCIGEEPITVIITFYKNGKKLTSVKSYLDVKLFEGTNASKSPASRTANNIEKISKGINHLASGFYKPQVKIVEMPE